MSKPLIALTLGDVAGIGPEVVLRACCAPQVREACVPLVFGHREVVARAAELVGFPGRIAVVEEAEGVNPEEGTLYCRHTGPERAAGVAPGRVDALGGQAAYEALLAAVEAARQGQVAGITTGPLHKEALRLAGIAHPGHTEILAEACGVEKTAMMLYLPPGESIRGENGLGVAHVTLHTSIASVASLLMSERIRETIELIDGFLQDIGCRQPRIAVCALNPHAGENGLFGDEELRLIAPAVREAQSRGLPVSGPFPADTLFRRAVGGEFDGVVAMYHDQGHIAFKLIGFDRAVNVTLGLPIIRTSPSHGTAFDIAWQGAARPDGMIEAIRVAVLLAQKRASD